jgi:hypothetical protein
MLKVFLLEVVFLSLTTMGTLSGCRLIGHSIHAANMQTPTEQVKIRSSAKCKLAGKGEVFISSQLLEVLQ